MAARDTGGRSAPQHIQQLVMREYCARIGKPFLLAATEYRMAGCTMVLDDVLNHEITQIEGIVMYSMFLLPTARAKRLVLYKRLEETGAVLHTAVEGYVIRGPHDATLLEECFLLYDVQSIQQADVFLTLTEWDITHAAN
jgi:sporadic carbohydrate cluster protein (TIGR04323 family)